jgi:AcrR family transcriptional regulator
LNDVASAGPVPRGIFRSHDVVTFDDRRDAILDTSIRLFELRGYDRTTIRDIADELRISNGTIYYYFKTKAAILTAVYERALDRALEKLKETAFSIADPKARMHALVKAIVELVLREQGLMKVFFREFESLDPELRAEISRKSRAYDDQVREALQAGIESGEFRSDLDPALVARIVVGAANWVHRWHQPDGPVGATELAEVVSTLLERGYLA